MLLKNIITSYPLGENLVFNRKLENRQTLESLLPGIKRKIEEVERLQQEMDILHVIQLINNIYVTKRVLTPFISLSQYTETTVEIL